VFHRFLLSQSSTKRADFLFPPLRCRNPGDQEGRSRSSVNCSRWLRWDFRGFVFCVITNNQTRRFLFRTRLLQGNAGPTLSIGLRNKLRHVQFPTANAVTQPAKRGFPFFVRAWKHASLPLDTHRGIIPRRCSYAITSRGETPLTPTGVKGEFSRCRRRTYIGFVLEEER